MNKIIKHLLAFSALFSLIWGQFKSEVTELNLPSAMHNRPAVSLSLLDPTRFSMQHGFSMSMIKLGNQSLSVGSYTNQMSYLLMDNLLLRTNFTLIQSGMTQSNGLEGQLYFGASLDYKPTKNSLIQFSFQNYPAYSRYRPQHFNLTPYR